MKITKSDKIHIVIASLKMGFYNFYNFEKVIVEIKNVL